MREMFVVLAVLVVGELCWLGLGLQLVNSPLVYGPWPEGVNETTLRSAAWTGIHACEQPQDPAPSGCPQVSGLPAPLRWTVAGDPLRHAGFEMIGKSGNRRQFQVWGTYAMVALAGNQAEAAEGPFIASLSWDGRQLKASGVRKGGFSTDRPPEATDDAAREEALRAFGTCATAPTAALCPFEGGNPIHLSPARPWLQGSSAVYDRATGVQHVRGSLPPGSPRQTYDAHETIGPGGRLICYLITYF